MKKFLAVFAISLSLASCTSTEPGGEKTTDDGPVPQKRHNIYLTLNEKQAVTQKNDFALELFRRVSEVSGNENIVIAPHSISTIVSMVANGAEGAVLEELKATLQSDNLSELNELNAKLIKELPTLDNTTVITLANSIWISPNFRFLSDFEETMRNSYDASLHHADFKTHEGVDLFNAWCSENTGGLIPTLLAQPMENIDIMLANASLFKGVWTSGFDRNKTAKATFNGITKKSSVDMMTSSNDFNVVEVSGITAARKSFGNSSFTITFLLPPKEKTLREISSDLASGIWSRISSNQWLASESNLYIPRFKASGNTDMLDVMKQWMPTAFGDYNTYEKIATPASIDEAIGYCRIYSMSQSVSIEVNEQGASAAAASQIGLGWVIDSGIDPVKVDFRADRPFIFIIEESSSGVILFMGAINDL